jgi:hypothetical protein
LRNRGLIAILISRFTPGLRLPTYLAAGFLRIPFRDFARYLALAVAAWTPLLVGMAVLFGDRLLRAAPVPAVLLLLFLMVRLLRTLLHFEERRKLIGFLRRIVQWEFWPPWAQYLPLVPYFVYLAIKHRSATIFTAANPGIFSGGLVGESKFDILTQLASRNDGSVPEFALIPAGDVEQRVAQASRWPTHPFVLKPNVGERGAGVAIIRSLDELQPYFESHCEDTIIQNYVAGYEVGISYIRRPHETTGRIVSITEKTFPVLMGDGKSTLAELILKDRRASCLADVYLRGSRQSPHSLLSPGEPIQLVELGSHCRGSIFLDGSRYKTPALEAAIDRLAKAHPGFFLGRFDIRTPSMDALAAGHSFQAIELNGVSAEPAHIYDPAVSLIGAYRALASQWRAAFEIGAENRARGFMPLTLPELIRLLRLSQRGTNKRNLLPMQEQYSRRADKHNHRQRKELSAIADGR